MKKHIVNIVFFLFAFIFIFAEDQNAPFYVNEFVSHYISDVYINEDGTLDVTEDIRVLSMGVDVKRGIYREFPTRYKDVYKNNYKVTFDLSEVLRDGKPEKYHITKNKNGLIIYIGSADVYLDSGFYDYKISYKTGRQMRFLGEHDELYWNVNGNRWLFEMDTIICRVHLPKGALKENITFDGYTGYAGESDKDLYMFVDSANEVIQFTGSRRFFANEGMTIVAGFAKGFIRKPSAKENFLYVMMDNRDILFALIGTIFLFLFLYTSWLKVGKDPVKGTVIPVYEPPDGLSPAEMRYIMKMGYDTKTTVSSLTNIAIKGHLIIEEKEGNFILKKNDGNEKKDLSQDEKDMFSGLFALVSEFILSNSNHEIMQGMIKKHKAYLSKKFDNKYFFNNTKYFVYGLLITIAVAVITFAISDKINPVALFMYVWLSIWTGGVIALLYTAFSMWKEAVKKKNSIGGAIFLSLFCIPFVLGEAVGIGVLATSSSFIINILFFTMVLLNILFYKWLKAPSIEGRIAMDKIEGFVMYLNAAEKDELANYGRVIKDIKYFEKYLPYAIALDVENGWTKAFAEVMEGMSKENSRGYRPLWYTGSIVSSALLAQTLTSSFTTAVTSSSTAPSRSSGSGFSGGSSGGGGGGGGGGGW